jgi:hypothetical protein
MSLTGRLLVFGLVLPGSLQAATWHVTFDPAEPEDRVGSVAAQAASGDTILIDPGTYYEHIPIEGKSLIFIGTAGAAQTILDGGRALEGREGSIIYTREGTGANLVLEGLTLQNGKGARWAHENDSCAGGAVLWWYDGWDVRSELTLRDCIFRDNLTDNSRSAGGGAVFAYHLRDLRVEGCSFFGNETIHQGGAFFIELVSRTLLEDCYFELNAHIPHGGTAIWYDGLQDLAMRGCTFESDVSTSGSAAIVGTPMKLEMLDNRFIDRRAQVATKVVFYVQMEGPPQELVISRNLFWWAAGPDSAADYSLTIYAPNGTFTLTENTFIRCGLAGQNYSGARPVIIERNIFARAAVGFFVGSGGSVRCNDFWMTDVRDAWGTMSFSDNLSAPPMFCNEPAGNLAIATNSPCAAEQSPVGCGRIGALDPACTGSAVRQVTWGRIKNLFR